MAELTLRQIEVIRAVMMTGTIKWRGADVERHRPRHKPIGQTYRRKPKIAPF